MHSSGLRVPGVKEDEKTLYERYGVKLTGHLKDYKYLMCVPNGSSNTLRNRRHMGSTYDLDSAPCASHMIIFRYQ